ncbi:MAG: hypothetical protein WC027_03580 [Candidatus Paceibacterota bacterium]
MANSNLDQRIVTVAEGLIGLQIGLKAARSFFGPSGDAAVSLFLDKVPETGEALWNRFKEYQKKFPGQEITFPQFIAGIVCH